MKNLNYNLLFERLTWPNLTVREKAAIQTYKLLKESQTDVFIWDLFFQWIKTQGIETEITNILTIFLRLDDDKLVDKDTFEKICETVTRPSILSHLMLQEMSHANNLAIPWSELHSGNPVSTFVVEEYFDKYKMGYVPPIYDINAKKLERDYLISFQQQWAYEWNQIVARENLEKISPPHYFIGNSSESMRILFDTKQSEAFRSAFLRALAWAVDINGLSESLAVLLAWDNCPLDIGLWQVSSISKPEWCLIKLTIDSDIDTKFGQMSGHVDELWENHGQGHSSQILAQASGLVHYEDHDIYNIEIMGFFQKFEGGEDPSNAEVLSMLNPGTALHTKLMRPSIKGEVQLARVDEHLDRLSGWTILPAIFRLSSIIRFPRWQADIYQRGVWIPAPYIFKESIEIFPTEHSLETLVNKQNAANWQTWNSLMTDKWYADVPPPVGTSLWINTTHIDEFREKHKFNFCWLVKLSCFFRESGYNAFEEVNLYKTYNITKVIQQ